MSTQEAVRIADALGVLLQRRFRSDLYARLTDGVHDAVDAASYPVISGVARTGPISAAALGQAIGLDRSVVSRRAAQLIDAGLLSAATDDTDARANLLSLTDAGRRVVKVLRRRLARAVDDHLAEWDLEDQQRFAALLGRFVEPGSL